MKKLRSISLLITVCLLIPFALTGCNDTSYGKCPAKQPGTQWQSEDGRIFIDSDEEGRTTGYFRFGNERVPIELRFEMNGSIAVGTYPTDDGYSVELGYFYRSGFYGEDSFSMSPSSSSRIKSEVTAYADKIGFEKLSGKKTSEFDISEYRDSTVLKNSETVFNATDDLYSGLYMEYERSDHSKFDSFIIAASLVDKGCKTAVTCDGAAIDSGVLTVNCTDGSGRSYEIRCDCVKHIIVE